MTNGIITSIEVKNNTREEYIRSKMRYNFYVRFDNLKTELSILICDTKTNYHSNYYSKIDQS